MEYTPVVERIPIVEPWFLDIKLSEGLSYVYQVAERGRKCV